jgi:hypothetical protein
VTAKLEPVFARLRNVLAAHASGYSVADDSARRYGLEAPAGPATVRARGGKLRAQTIPVAWVEVRKAYVSFHLMGVAGHPKLAASLSSELRARMKGKSCFNFKTVDDALMSELARVTEQSLLGMKKAGYVSDAPDA